MQAAAWKQVRPSLAVRLDHMGDEPMTVPAFAAIKDTLPDAEVAVDDVLRTVESPRENSDA